MTEQLADDVNHLVWVCMEAEIASGWRKRDDPVNIPRSLCLIHEEISEVLGADRRDLMDDKLPHRKGVEVELADAMIRICNLAGALGLDLGGALSEKLAFNATRADFIAEERAKPNGKKY